MVGVGGQGILLATQIAARAALIRGHDVKTNEVHGMAQRGGSVVAQIRFGEKVFSPLVPDGTAQVLASAGKDRSPAHSPATLPRTVWPWCPARRSFPSPCPRARRSIPRMPRRRLRAAFQRLAYIDAVGVAEKICDTRVANVVLLGAMSTALDLPAEVLGRGDRAVREAEVPPDQCAGIRRGQEAGRRRLGGQRASPSGARCLLSASTGVYCITDNRSL